MCSLCLPLISPQIRSLLLHDFPSSPASIISMHSWENIEQSSSSCSYTVTITTSCSSPRYTRDQISLSFGDAYGYQLSEGISQDTCELVEEFLSKWKYVNDRYIIPATAESNAVSNRGRKSEIRVEEYLEVVEVYVVAFVGVAMKDVDSAVSWVEKAFLPMDEIQDLLRRLQSLYSPKTHGQSQDSVPSPTNGRYQTHSNYLQEQQQPPKELDEPLKAPYAPSRDSTKQSILKLLQQKGRNIWWFRSITLKLRSRGLAISHGKLVMGCLMVLVYYILKRKGISLKENIKTRALSVKKDLVELWDLAFSHQVNSLAAVQRISTATIGRHG